MQEIKQIISSEKNLLLQDDNKYSTLLQMVHVSQYFEIQFNLIWNCLSIIWGVVVVSGFINENNMYELLSLIRFAKPTFGVPIYSEK